jgi:outer membrane protein insertion porin family
VAFFDAGNIYPNVRALKGLDLRYSPGIGVRFNTPFVLLRFDLGFNPWAHSGEPRRQFTFGIGQAF